MGVKEWPAGASAAAVALNTTHRTSDGTDHSDVVLNTAYFADTNFTGFTDPDNEVTCTWSDSTPDRTLSIDATGASFSFYSGATKYTKTSAETKQITDVEGSHYIYYDTSGALQVTTTWTNDLILVYALVAVIYWDATNSKQIYFGREYKHSIQMSNRTHLYEHNVDGFALESGGALGNFVIDDTGADDEDARFSNAATVCWDEDARFSHSARTATTNIPILYRSGADASNIWRIDEDDAFPVLTTGTGRAAYNQNNAGTWQQTELTNNQFVLAHVLATNDTDRPFVIIQGQADYANIVAARDGAETEITSIITEGLPLPEFKFLGTVILQTSDSYANTVKSRTRTTSGGDDYIDLRNQVVGNGTGGVTVTDHNDLAGLQGGTTDEYYHLTSAQHTNLTDTTILTVDGTYKGDTLTVDVDTNSVGFGGVLAQAADFSYDEADADAIANSYMLVVALEAGTGSKLVLTQGQVCDTAWNWSAGAIYLSTTLGTFTQTAPSGTDDTVIICGFALSADTIYFNPYGSIVEHA